MLFITISQYMFEIFYSVERVGRVHMLPVERLRERKKERGRKRNRKN